MKSVSRVILFLPSKLGFLWVLQKYQEWWRRKQKQPRARFVRNTWKILLLQRYKYHTEGMILLLILILIYFWAKSRLSAAVMSILEKTNLTEYYLLHNLWTITMFFTSEPIDLKIKSLLLKFWNDINPSIRYINWPGMLEFFIRILTCSRFSLILQIRSVWLNRQF